MIHCRRDFIARDALRERHAVQGRTKVTLIWNNDDVFAVMRESLVLRKPRAEFIDLPVPVYASFPADSVEVDDRHSGNSQRMSYSSMWAVLSQVIVDLGRARSGTEAFLLCGEPNPRRGTVESHEIREIRVTTAPVPCYEETIREV